MEIVNVTKLELDCDELEMLRKVRDWANMIHQNREEYNISDDMLDPIIGVYEAIENLFDYVRWDEEC